MPATTPLPFWSQSSSGRNKIITAERIRNWYLQKNPPQSISPFSLMPTPGLSPLFSAGDGPCRGIWPMYDTLYVVSGGEIYTVDVHYNTTKVGDIPGAGDCYMSDNGAHVLVVPASGTDLAFAVNASGTTQITETGLQGAAYQDGYLISGKRGSEQFNISNLDDATVWTSTDFSSADALADFLVAVACVHRQLWCFGTETIERWYDSGNATFPFERIQGSFVEIGCGAPMSVAVADNKVLWVGHDWRVYISSGGEPQVISTDAIGYAIEQETAPQSAVGWVYTQDHHVFYVLEFSSVTVVYDLTTGLWHHRKSISIDRWRAHMHAWVWNKHIVGDYSNAQYYELSPTTYDDDGDTIRREADSAPLFAKGNMAIMHELLVGMRPGVGIDGSGQGSDPDLMVSWSDDDGATWSNELTLKMGKIGVRDTEARLAGLGGFRRRSVRIAVSDPVNAVIPYAMHRTEGLQA